MPGVRSIVAVKCATGTRTVLKEIVFRAGPVDMRTNPRSVQRGAVICPGHVPVRREEKAAGIPGLKIRYRRKASSDDPAGRDRGYTTRFFCSLLIPLQKERPFGGGLFMNRCK
jgi:hypothetical protein